VVVSDKSLHPIARSDVRVEELDDELVLYDPRNGRAYVLNSTAALIWQLCDGSLSRQALADEIKQEFGLEDADVLTDVEAYLSQLEGAGLLASRLP
jgi:PqqD family protein of HPr-rel-A system